MFIGVLRHEVWGHCYTQHEVTGTILSTLFTNVGLVTGLCVQSTFILENGARAFHF